MANDQSIDSILHQWPFDPDELGVRLVLGDDGREILQMRIDMGLLQLEVLGRPDGVRPNGFETYFDYLLGEVQQQPDLELNEEQCLEVDREFVQFYHRRICWLTLREFEKAVADADHTLTLMDFCTAHSPDDQWTLSHEQYRPFVMFHRIQAAALGALEEDDPEAAVHQINMGLGQLESLFVEHDADELFEDDELVVRLIELRESVRDHYEVGQTLQEQLDDAVAREQYELAAKLRDLLAQRSPHH